MAKNKQNGQNSKEVLQNEDGKLGQEVEANASGERIASIESHGANEADSSAQPQGNTDAIGSMEGLFDAHTSEHEHTPSDRPPFRTGQSAQATLGKLAEAAARQALPHATNDEQELLAETFLNALSQAGAQQSVEKSCNFLTGELRAALSDKAETSIKLSTIEAYKTQLDQEGVDFNTLGRSLGELSGLEGLLNVTMRKARGYETCVREVPLNALGRREGGCGDLKLFKNFSEELKAGSEVHEIELKTAYSWRDNWQSEANGSSRWIILRSNDPRDRTMRILGSILPFFPVAMQTVLDFIRDPLILVEIHESLVEKDSTIKWGYNTYRENNWRYSVVDLYQALSRKYSNLSAGDARGLAIFTMLQLALIDLRPSRYVYEEVVLTMPVYMPVLSPDDFQVDLDLAVKRNAYRQLLVKFEELSGKFVASDREGMELFKVGSPMIKHDVKTYLAPRRLALHRMLVSVKRLENDLAKLELYTFLNLMKVQGDELDVLGDALSHPLVLKMSQNMNMVFSALTKANDFISQVSMGLHSEIEAKLALDRIAEHLEANPDLNLELLDDDLPEHLEMVSSSFEGDRKGLVLMQGVEGVGNVVVGQTSPSYAVNVFKNLETHDYKNTSLKLTELRKQLSFAVSTTEMLNSYKNELSDTDLFSGFITNMNEKWLWRHVLKTQQNKIFYMYDPSEDTDFLAPTILGSLQKPVVVFPCNIVKGVSTPWMREEYIAAGTAYLTDPLYALFLRRLQHAPAIATVKGKKIESVDCSIPLFSARDHISMDFLGDFMHGTADQVITVHYTPDDSLVAQGAASEGYTASYRLGGLLSNEILRDTQLCYDQAFQSITSYNRRVKDALLDMLEENEAAVLQIDKGQTRMAWDRATNDYKFLKQLISTNLVVRKLTTLIAMPILTSMAKDISKSYRVLAREQKIRLINKVAVEVVRMLNGLLRVMEEESLDAIIARARTLKHFQHESLLGDK